MNLVLRRDPNQSGPITYGVLEGAGGPYQTLELPFRKPVPIGAISVKDTTASVTITQPGGSARGSCVPEGIYALARHNSPKHPFTWALVNASLQVFHETGDVEGEPAPGDRFAILLHTGNTALDSEGCILVGTERTNLFTTPGVMESRMAFDKLKAHLPWVEGHTITILGKGATP